MFLKEADEEKVFKWYSLTEEEKLFSFSLVKKKIIYIDHVRNEFDSCKHMNFYKQNNQTKTQVWLL